MLPGIALLASLVCVFPPGTEGNPSAVAPLEANGEPCSFWWDELAFHVGDRMFPWVDVGIAPTNGAQFKLDLGEDTNRKRIVLEGTLRNGASRYRISRLGLVGNAECRIHAEVDVTVDGTLTTQLYASGMTPDYVALPMTKNVRVGDKGEFDVKARLPSSGTFGYRLCDADGRSIYYCSGTFRASALPFDFKYVWTDIPNNRMVVNTAGWMDDDGCVLRVTAKDYLTDSIAIWTKSVPLEKLWGEREYGLDVVDLPPGFYRLHLDYLNREGKVIHTDAVAYMKPQRKMPWDGTSLGAEDTVPPPWTEPIFGDDGTFRCWNRTVLIGGEGLIRSVNSGGKEVLSRPVQLIADGKPLAFDVRLEERKVSKATYRLAARNAAVTVKVTCEFDGFMLFEATFPSTIRSLSWKVAADRKYVTGFDDCSREDNPSAYFGKGTSPAIDFNPGQKQMWWMPGRVGIMGGVINLHGWHVRNLEKGGRVRSTPEAIEVTTDFVDEAMSGGPDRTVQFFMEPTPAKPKDSFYASIDEKNWTFWTDVVTKYFETRYPGFEDRDRLLPFLDDMKKGKPVFFYTASGGVSPRSPFWGWYRKEWNRFGIAAFAHEVPLVDKSRWDRSNWAYGCLNSRSFFDYKLWGVDWMLHEYIPDMKNLYVDLANPGPCNNVEHGCAWKDDFGRQMNDWAILPTRELHKRIYRRVKAKNPDGALYGHPGARRGPSDVFFDITCAGEGFTRKLHNNGYTYYELFTPEVMQSFFVPRGQEVVMVVIPQFLRARRCWAPHLVSEWKPHEPATDRAIRHFIAYLKIHDLIIPRRPDAAEGDQFYKVDSLVRRIRFGGDYSAYFHETGHVVTVSASHPRFLWSWFSKGGNSVLVLLNDTDQAVRQKISVKGLSAKGKEILDDTSFDFADGTCEIDFAPRQSYFIEFSSRVHVGKSCDDTATAVVRCDGEAR